MRRAVYFFQVVVIVRVLVLVPYDEADGGSGRLPFKDTGEEFYLIGLFARCGKDRLSRSSPVQFLLYKLFVDGNARRKSVNHSSDSFPMRLPEACKSKNIPK